MRRVAALYDIHGNLPALEAVLEEIRHAEVDHIVVGGDVLPGPMPRESLAMLRDIDIPLTCIRGNGDRAVLEVIDDVESAAVPEFFKASMRWVAAQLDAQDARELRSWPQTTRIQMPTLGAVLFCHATPRSDTEIFTRLTSAEALVPLFDGLGVDVAVCGHTHMQFDRMVGQTRLVNAGSVGMPFQAAGAYWLLLDADVRLMRTHYDLAGAAAQIRETGYPLAESFAAQNVLQPPSEESMLATFAKVQLT
ncbi:MAG: metallophosphoesterase family protein [bacterium]